MKRTDDVNKGKPDVGDCECHVKDARTETPLRNFRIPTSPEPMMSRARALSGTEARRLQEAKFGSQKPSVEFVSRYRGRAPGPSLPLLPDEDLEPVSMLNLDQSPVSFLPWGQSADLKGKIYFRAASPNNLGLVILCHGVLTMSIDNAYWTVMETYGRQFASLGFVAISIFHAEDGKEAAAKRFIDNINFFMQKNAATYKLSGKPLALFGHSEGAHGAVLAADMIRSGATSPHFKEVSALIALAPAFRDGATLPPGNFTKSLLILAGTHDYDGNAQGGRSLFFYPEKDPLASQHFFWGHGFNHTSFLDAQGEADTAISIFSDGGPFLDAKTRVQGSTQRLVTRNYAAMFLLWRLAGKTIYKKVFVGTGKVSWTNLDSEQKKDFQNLHVPPRFDVSGSFLFGAKPSFLGFYTNANLTQVIDAQHPAPFGPINQLTFSCQYQEAFRYLVAWDRTKNPSPTILVDCDPATLALGLAAIDFDAVLLNNSSLNPATPTAVQIAVALRHKSIPFLKSESVLVLIEPSMFVAAKSSNDGHPALYRTVLSTIRVPFSRFKVAADKLKDYTKLEFSFGASAVKGQIVIGGFRGALV